MEIFALILVLVILGLMQFFSTLKEELKNEVSKLVKNEVSTLKEELNVSLVKLFNERSGCEDDKSSAATTVSTAVMKPINASKIKMEEVSALLSKLGLNLIDVTPLGPQLKAEREVFW